MAPCKPGLYNWPCFTAGGSESQWRWVTCLKPHEETVALQGCWTRILQQVQLPVNPPASLLLAQVVGADQRMDGEKKTKQIWVTFFIWKKANYFSQGLLAASLTLSSQRIFWMYFACLFSCALCGEEEGGWGAPELGQDWMSYSREKVIWAIPKQGGGDLPLYIGPVELATDILYHSLPHPFPPTYACGRKEDKKVSWKAAFSACCMHMVWGSLRSHHTLSCSRPCLYKLISKHPCFVNI